MLPFTHHFQLVHPPTPPTYFHSSFSPLCLLMFTFSFLLTLSVSLIQSVALWLDDIYIISRSQCHQGEMGSRTRSEEPLCDEPARSSPFCLTGSQLHTGRYCNTAHTSNTHTGRQAHTYTVYTQRDNDRDTYTHVGRQTPYTQVQVRRRILDLHFSTTHIGKYVNSQQSNSHLGTREKRVNHQRQRSTLQWNAFGFR